MTETKQIPRYALSLKATAELGDNGANAKTAPFRMVARSNEAVLTPWTGWTIHDFAGMQTKRNRLNIDYVHDEIVGYANKWDTSTNELVASGVIHSVVEGDRAQEIILRGRGDLANGIEPQPYEASISFDDMVIETIPEGFSVTVNGKSFAGPLSVIREWTLRGIAVCPYGMDGNTSTEFAAGDMADVRIYTMETKNMADDTAVGTTVVPEATQAVDSPAVVPAETVVDTVVDKVETTVDVVVDTLEKTAETVVDATVVAATAVAAVVEEVVEEAVEAVKDVVVAVEEMTVTPVETENKSVVEAVVEGEATKTMAVEPQISTVFAQQMAVKDETIAKLTAENTEMKSRLNALACCGAQKPVSFQAEENAVAENINGQRFSELSRMTSAGIAAYAASLKMPE